MSSEIMTPIFPLEVFSTALCNSRTSFPYSARWLTKTVPGVMRHVCRSRHIEAYARFALILCELPHTHLVQLSENEGLILP
jgi:hypothetical protein